MSKNAIATLGSQLEWVLKLAGVLAVIGFLVLRARYKYLGIPWDSALLLDPDRYLLELWNLGLFVLGKGVLPLAVWWLLSFATAALLWLLVFTVLPRLLPNETVVQGLQGFKASDQSVTVGVLIVITAVSVSAILLLRLHDLQGNLIGDLSKGVEHLDSRIVQGGLLSLAVVVIALLKLETLRWLRRLLQASAAILVVLLINAYGYSGDRASFPCASYQVSNGPDRLALLLQELPDHFLFWRIEAEHEAFVDVVTKEQVTQLRLGPPVDIVRLGRACSRPVRATAHPGNPEDACQLMISPPKQPRCSLLSVLVRR